jgi:capsular polysaccharide transport system permease protein
MPDDAQFATYARVLRLTPVDPLGTDGISRPTAEGSASRTVLPRTIKGLASFLVLIILPNALVLSYLWGFAADRFEVKATFILRTPGRTVSAPSAAMSELLDSSRATRAGEEGYIVQEFLESRDAMLWAQRRAALREAYAKPTNDPLWRFPNFFTSASDEGLYEHYRHMISSSFDSSTGLNTLKVQAFTADDARIIANSLLEAAEELVNRLNRRAQEDARSIAAHDLALAKQRALEAQEALTAFRERELLIDPSQLTLTVLETIGRLSFEAAQTGVDIAQLEKSAAKSAQVGLMRTRQAALEAQIAKERHRLAGSAAAIAPRIAEYERLMLERGFAEKALLGAMTSFEVARQEALRERIYLEQVARPNQPDYPAYPWKVAWSVGIFLGSLMLWHIWRTLVKDIGRHLAP